MSIARIAYRIIDDGEVVGVTMSRDKAIEYWRDGCEVWTRIRWCCSNGRWYYERRGWKKHPKQQSVAHYKQHRPSRQQKGD